MSRRAGEWRARILLLAFSIGLTLALGEAAARVLLRPDPPGPVEGTPISELSPTLGWSTKANGSQRIRREDFEVTVEINSRGLRGPEIPYIAPPGHRRLAIMGDSFAHGYYAEEPETLRGRLARELGPCRVDVVNAGSPGYSTDQEWLYFQEEIEKYGASEVVLLFYYNDLHFNTDAMGTANREKPVFVEEGGSWEMARPAIRDHARPGPDEQPSQDEGRVPRRLAPRFRSSALWAFVVDRLQRRRPDWSRALSEHGLAPALSSVPPAEYLPFTPDNAAERARVERMWKVTAELLGRFRDDVRVRGGGFTVFYVPARFEVNDEAWSYVQRRYDPERSWRRDAVSGRLSEVLKALDIPLVEAGEAFKAAEASPRKAYLPSDGHWNGQGNEIAARTLLPMMRRAFSCAS